MTIKDVLNDLAKKYNVKVRVDVDISFMSKNDRGYCIQFKYPITKWLEINKTFYIDTPGYNGTKDYKFTSEPIRTESEESNVSINQKYIDNLTVKLQLGYDNITACASEFVDNYKQSIIDGLKSGKISD